MRMRAVQAVCAARSVGLAASLTVISPVAAAEGGRQGDEQGGHRERAHDPPTPTALGWSLEPLQPTSVTARLGLVAFLVGGATLATEISASRLLAPYFGASTVVWANVIGLTLAYLALGYWLGGRLADRRPDPRVLGLILLVAATALAVTPFAARPFLRWALHGFDSVSVGSVVGSFFAALALFAVPVTALGAAAPFLVRLALDSVNEAGRVAGRLYALSTAGSLVGTFSPPWSRSNGSARSGPWSAPPPSSRSAPASCSGAPGCSRRSLSPPRSPFRRLRSRARSTRPSRSTSTSASSRTGVTGVSSS
jgi:hypothetical protein